MRTKGKNPAVKQQVVSHTDRPGAGCRRPPFSIGDLEEVVPLHCCTGGGFPYVKLAALRLLFTLTVAATGTVGDDAGFAGGTTTAHCVAMPQVTLVATCVPK
jgi:hypothetical protein